jgi:molybdopterin synthase sulfur carrier subunit
MKVKVRALAGFRHILGKELSIQLEDVARIEDLLIALCANHRDLHGAIYGESGLKDDVNIMVNGRNIDSLEGGKTKLADGDEVAIFPAAIGG